MSNVLMINSAYDGCSYVRIMLPAFHNGFSMDKTSRTSERKPLGIIKKELEWADIVVFHRPENEEYAQLIRILKEAGKKIVVDNDDTFKLTDFHPLAEFTPGGKKHNSLAKRTKLMDNAIKTADLVTTTTEFLAKEYRKLNKNVVVLPNYVDPMDWGEPKRTSGKVRVGIIGSTAIEYDYLHIKPVLRNLSDRKDVELVMFGLGNKEHRKKNPIVTKVFKEEYKFWDSLNIDHFPWCPNYEYQDRLNDMKLDFMIIPRKDNYFNRCKSNIKFLEASMLEIPVIAQSFDNGPYEERTPDMGILIKDNKDWEEAIERLILNKHLRRTMGETAKQYVLKNYNIETNYLKWADAYQTL